MKQVYFRTKALVLLVANESKIKLFFNFLVCFILTFLLSPPYQSHLVSILSDSKLRVQGGDVAFHVQRTCTRGLTSPPPPMFRDNEAVQ